MNFDSFMFQDVAFTSNFIGRVKGMMYSLLDI